MILKKITLLFTLSYCAFTYAQKNPQITSIDFVQVLNNHSEEAHYYFKNNWEVLRDMAIKKNYIQSFQFLKTERSKEAPFDYILITTYKNQHQFNLREKHFEELIKIKGKLILLNEIKPSNFRKTLFSKDTYHQEN